MNTPVHKVLPYENGVSGRSEFLERVILMRCACASPENGDTDLAVDQGPDLLFNVRP